MTDVNTTTRFYWITSVNKADQCLSAVPEMTCWWSQTVTVLLLHWLVCVEPWGKWPWSPLREAKLPSPAVMLTPCVCFFLSLRSAVRVSVSPVHKLLPPELTHHLSETLKHQIFSPKTIFSWMMLRVTTSYGASKSNVAPRQQTQYWVLSHCPQRCSMRLQTKSVIWLKAMVSVLAAAASF